MGVFGAVGRPQLVFPYLLALATSTLLFLALTAPRLAKSRRNLLMVTEQNSFLEWPSLKAVWRESYGMVSHFLKTALPIFVLIATIASLIGAFGWLAALGKLLSPVMSLFNLPAATALPTAMACIRKDGIFLLAEQGTARELTNGQLLTAVYLAGTLVPCLVTLLTISKEKGKSFAGTLLLKQAAASVAFAAIIGWGTATLHW